MQQVEEDVLEQEILQHLALQQKDEALTLALGKYGPQILGYLIRVTHGETAGREAYSGFLEALVKGIGSFQGAGALKRWLYKVATRAAFAYLRDPFQRRALPLGTSEAGRLPQPALEPTISRRTDKQDAIDRIRQSLAPHEQALLTLRLDKTMEFSEIAPILWDGQQEPSPADLHKKAAALRKQYQRIKERIILRLKDEGLL